MTIADEVQDIMKGEKPGNEADTRSRVIDTLLRAIGYPPRDWWAGARNEAGEFPDYTILRGTENEFYLEAKSWGYDLDPCVFQALKYPHDAGRRWVVLTNGLVWRLYDDQLPGKPAQRLVAEMSLEHTDKAVEFLTAIGKESVTRGGLESFAKGGLERRKNEETARKHTQQQAQRRNTLLAALRRQLADEKSEVIQAIHDVLCKQAELQGISPSDVAACAQELSSQRPTVDLGKPLSGTALDIDSIAQAMLQIVNTKANPRQSLQSMPRPRSPGKNLWLENAGRERLVWFGLWRKEQEDEMWCCVEISSPQSWRERAKKLGLSAGVYKHSAVWIDLFPGILGRHGDFFSELLLKAVEEYQSR